LLLEIKAQNEKFGSHGRAVCCTSLASYFVRLRNLQPHGILDVNINVTPSIPPSTIYRLWSSACSYLSF